jgi:hypothetical protein
MVLGGITADHVWSSAASEQLFCAVLFITRLMCAVLHTTHVRSSWMCAGRRIICDACLQLHALALRVQQLLVSALVCCPAPAL